MGLQFGVGSWGTASVSGLGRLPTFFWSDQPEPKQAHQFSQASRCSSRLNVWTRVGDRCKPASRMPPHLISHVCQHIRAATANLRRSQFWCRVLARVWQWLKQKSPPFACRRIDTKAQLRRPTHVYDSLVAITMITHAAPKQSR